MRVRCKPSTRHQEFLLCRKSSGSPERDSSRYPSMEKTGASWDLSKG